MNLFTASFALSLATAATLLAGLIKTKVWAVYLGPHGVGLMSQLYNYQLFLSLLASFGMAQGVTKYIAEYNQAGNKDGADAVLNTALSFSLFLSLVCIAITVIAAPFISRLVLGNKVFYLLMIIAIIGVPFQVIGETYLAFLQGYHRVDKIVKANLWISFFSLLSAIPMIIFFRLAGAAVHLTLMSMITCIFFSWQFGKGASSFACLSVLRNMKGLFRSALLKRLFSFGFLRLIQIAAGPIAILIVRSLVIRYQGPAQNGIYQAASSFSVFFIPIILNILCSYSYPAFCKARSNTALAAEVNRFFHFSFLVSLPIIVFILLVRYPLIRLVYASTFKLAALILPLQLLGDFVRVMAMPLGSALVSREQLRVGIICELAWNALFVAAAVALLPFFGISILLLAYVASYVLNFIMLYANMVSLNGFRMNQRNWILAAFSITLILAAGFLPLSDYINLTIFSILSLIWLLLILPSSGNILDLLNKTKGARFENSVFNT